jgi:hypothetical protein
VVVVTGVSSYWVIVYWGEVDGRRRRGSWLLTRRTRAGDVDGRRVAVRRESDDDDDAF